MSWIAESSKTARQHCRQRQRAVLLVSAQTQMGQLPASTAATALVQGMVLPMAGSATQMINGDRPGIASVVAQRQVAAVLHQTEAAAGKKTSGTAIAPQ